MKRVLTGLFCILAVIALNGQTKTVTGKVTTFKTIPVEKAQIMVKSSNLKYFSDSLGFFTLTCEKEDVLTVSAKGFVNGRIRIREKIYYAIINLKLEPGDEGKEFAIGNGHVRDKEKLYAMASQSDGSIDYTRYKNIYEALEGNFTGVQVLNGVVIVRNSSSFGQSAPALLIVDGREVSKDYLGNISPVEIENITVLKDASASAYGVRGGNGVVVVETKRGDRK